MTKRMGQKRPQRGSSCGFAPTNVGQTAKWGGLAFGKEKAGVAAGLKSLGVMQ